ncbi:putative pectin lyase [Vibrio phage 66E30.1]|nr:hypothetical protein PODOV053v2_p0015 [Vibrio phage 24E30.2]QZI91283.1 hypothetical protein PODOV052v2_p0015 [Vibrio phage 24E35.2]QZI91446.1 hypothetical protein PODOV048v2_p0015 [Vibrio phage 34E29.1]QZI91483.1 hypothetical protein PODOV007v2_p0015 [Vibrio phage 36E38.1]QZI91752.1 tailspike protein [Vibrio phage 44E38.1]QZI91789.1 hypothetical protein PODOV046v2_p0015 [Vibrio phage 44E38.2]QZI91979.1 hypothetical protein PODOV051v2_p0015 [Vibrio phage 64E30.1]QZI92018.1 putative pectin 
MDGGLLFAIPLNGIKVEDFGLLTSNDASDNTSAWDEMIQKIVQIKRSTVMFGGGDYLSDEMFAEDINITIKGDGRGSTRLINKGSGSVFKLIRSSGEFTKKLKLIGLSFGEDTTESVHTSSGSHAVHVDNYNDCQFEDVQINQAGGSGIYCTDIFVQSFENIQGGHCGNNSSMSPSDRGVIEYERVSTGNSIRISDSYISNSTLTNGVRINNAQSISILNTTLESCLDLISIGRLGNTSRNVTIDTCYFENPIVSCGNFISIFGLSLRNLYCNLVGPRSDVNWRNFRFEECDRVKLNNCSLNEPGDPSNPNYKAALEFVTGTSLSYKGQVVIEECSSMQTVCVDSTTAGRSAQNIIINRCGLDIVELRGLEKPHTNLLTNTDLTTWANTGALPIYTRDFYDGGVEYVISGDNSNTLNTSVSGTFNIGDDLVFSAYMSGKCRLRLRGRRVSDGGFEDIAIIDKIGSETGKNEGGDISRRAYANGVCLDNYDLINVQVRPTSGYDVGVAYVQVDRALTPTAIA